MKNFYKKIIFLLILGFLVVSAPIALAGASTDLKNKITLEQIPTVISSIVSVIWKIFVGIAVIMFMVAGIKFLTSYGDPEKIKEARRFVIWGSIGIVVAIMGYSIVQVLKDIVISDGSASDNNAPTDPKP